MGFSKAPRFHDGKTSSPKEVGVALSGQFLLISQGREVIAKWPISGLYIKEDWNDEIGVVVGSQSNPDASLAIFQHQLFITIRSRLPRPKRATYIIPARVSVLAGLAIVAVIAVYLLFPVVSQLAKWTTYLVPFELEQKLGEIALDALADEYQSCEDKAAKAYLERISRRLLASEGASSAEDRVRPSFHLFRTRETNAFTLPGEKMAVLSGFLSSAKSEAEVAGVLAHEYGHMVKRDALEAFVEAQGFGLIAKLAGSSGAYGELTEIASVMQILKYSRKKEYAADAFAVRMLHQAGYPADGLAEFLSRMDEDREVENPVENMISFEMFSTHPETQERIAQIKALSRVAPASGQRKTSLSDAEFQRLKEACPVSTQKAD